MSKPFELLLQRSALLAAAILAPTAQANFCASLPLENLGAPENFTVYACDPKAEKNCVIAYRDGRTTTVVRDLGQADAAAGAPGALEKLTCLEKEKRGMDIPFYNESHTSCVRYAKETWTYSFDRAAKRLQEEYRYDDTKKKKLNHQKKTVFGCSVFNHRGVSPYAKLLQRVVVSPEGKLFSISGLRNQADRISLRPLTGKTTIDVTHDQMARYTVLKAETVFKALERTGQVNPRRVDGHQYECFARSEDGNLVRPKDDAGIAVNAVPRETNELGMPAVLGVRATFGLLPARRDEAILYEYDGNTVLSHLDDQSQIKLSVVHAMDARAARASFGVNADVFILNDHVCLRETE